MPKLVIEVNISRDVPTNMAGFAKLHIQGLVGAVFDRIPDNADLSTPLEIRSPALLAQAALPDAPACAVGRLFLVDEDFDDTSVNIHEAEDEVTVIEAHVGKDGVVSNAGTRMATKDEIYNPSKDSEQSN